MPYTTYARFHDSPDAPLVKIRWYRTNLPPIRFPTAFNNRFLDPDSELPRPVGEVALWEANRNYNDKWQQPGGLDGKHQCSAEFFAGGQPWPYDGPPIEYDASWIPECCTREGGVEIGGEAGDKYSTPDATSGGVEVGGEAGDKFRGVDPTSGGVEVGGEAGDVFDAPDATSGGVEVGGEAGDVFITPDSAQGGVEVGGSAGDVFDATDATSGGVEVGGSAGDVFDATDSAEGGVVVGGEAGDVFTTLDSAQGGVEVGGSAGDVFDATDATSGGVEVGGSAGDVFSALDPTSGGVEVGGSAGDVFSALDPTSGGVEVGGEAGDVFVPPTPTPGTFCDGAPNLSLGVEYAYHLPTPFGPDQWWHWSVSPGTYHLTTTGLPPADGLCILEADTGCPPAGVSTNVLVGCTTFNTTTYGNVWLLIQTFTGTGTEPYTFRLDPGPCP